MKETDIPKEVLESFSPQVSDEMLNALDQTQYFHGTGNKQKNESGALIEKISTQGLVPQPDYLNTRVGLNTTSVTGWAKYALLYALLNSGEHNFNWAKKPNAPAWKTVRNSFFRKLIFSRNCVSFNYLGWLNGVESLLKNKGISVPKSKLGFIRTYLNWAEMDTTTSAENFPILIGIKSEIPTLKLADWYAPYEQRTDKVIPPADFSFLSVPMNQLDRVRSKISTTTQIPLLSLEHLMLVDLLQKESGYLFAQQNEGEETTQDFEINYSLAEDPWFLHSFLGKEAQTQQKYEHNQQIMDQFDWVLNTWGVLKSRTMDKAKPDFYWLSFYYKELISQPDYEEVILLLCLRTIQQFPELEDSIISTLEAPTQNKIKLLLNTKPQELTDQEDPRFASILTLNQLFRVTHQAPKEADQLYALFELIFHLYPQIPQTEKKLKQFVPNYATEMSSRTALSQSFDLRRIA